MGKKEDWEFSEKVLESTLKSSKMNYKISEGGGAFYGPKIDFHLTDSLGRSWQCATIQLDMQMPERFDLTYIGKDNKSHRPIMLHRALLGSVERFIGILLEHLDGKLPLWLSPIQVRVINFTDRNTKATEKIVKQLKEKVPELRIDSDLESTTVSEKVRQAEILRIPYIIVIGDKEEKSKTLAVRSRGEKPKFGVKFDDFVKEVQKENEGKLLQLATENLSQIPGLKILGTAPQKGPILTFHIEGVHPLDLATLLDLKHIAIRSGHLCAQPLLRGFGIEAAARVSFGIYNTAEDVDRFSEELKRILPAVLAI